MHKENKKKSRLRSWVLSKMAEDGNSGRGEELLNKTCSFSFLCTQSYSGSFVKLK